MDRLPREGALHRGQIIAAPMMRPPRAPRAGRLWPTPTARFDARRHDYTITGHVGTTLLDALLIAEYGVSARGESGVTPHPHFIEALMGYPIGWTSVTSATQLTLL